VIFRYFAGICLIWDNINRYIVHKPVFVPLVTEAGGDKATPRRDQEAEAEEAMTSTRKFCCDDLFRFNNVNLDVLTETVGDLGRCW
jgi:hypothetical protein